MERDKATLLAMADCAETKALFWAENGLAHNKQSLLVYAAHSFAIAAHLRAIATKESDNG